MPIKFILPLCMLIGMISWTLVIRWYVHPLTAKYPVQKILQALLILHTFRYVGMMFLIAGVTNGALDERFSVHAAYGDLIAAFLAFVALIALRSNSAISIPVLLVFNVWGLADLINAVGRGLLYNQAGALGATYWIPSTIVPLLLVTHFYIFFLLSKKVYRQSI